MVLRIIIFIARFSKRMKREFEFVDETPCAKKQKKQMQIDTMIEKWSQSLLDQNGGIRRSIIYADPPWAYTIKHHDKGTTMTGLSNQHYKTMTLKQLKQLKVKEIAAPNCILFLWTTGPQLINAGELMKAWVFQYKTMFMTWVKTTNGQVKANRLGFYTRQSCEYVLMGSRGNVFFHSRIQTIEMPFAIHFKRIHKNTLVNQRMSGS
jgi:N6-adenosine-specific RNA methylase IME4